MRDSAHKAIAIVGVGAVMPDAPDAATFWQNIKTGKYSISDVIPERWDPELYYDPDRRAPDKSYSRIGGWVRDFQWDPLKWRLPIPPKVSAGMDLTQKWAIVATRAALADFGYPGRALDPERTAVILGNAMGGDMHLYSASRIFFPEYARELANAPSFASVSPELRNQIIDEMRAGIGKRFPVINEDTMPGELSNVVAGRIAALYDFHGPNYVADAACASAMAAISAAVEGLAEHDYDTVITGGIDANMSASTFVKFSKIGALSATGTRPYAKGADGFVMGEGAALFVLKRLADAERDGDKIYAVIRGLGGSSDGKGKGITAPNPVGQTIAMRRAWENAGLSPSTVGLVEGHGTSTAVGDVVEVQCLNEVFGQNGLGKNSVALGSVKSNIGHLKGAAGAAGIFKAAMALNEKVLPPSVNFNEPNPNIDFSASPFYVNTELREWQAGAQDVRRAGVSAFGFGGTNFHAVLEEYIPGRIKTSETVRVASGLAAQVPPAGTVTTKAPLRGAMLIGGSSYSDIASRVQGVLDQARKGQAPSSMPPLQKDLLAPVRLAIDYGSADELASKAEKALKALETDNPGMWRVLRAKGVFLGRGPAPKTAFLFTGQGSQYVNMLRDFRDGEPIVRDIFWEADEVMAPLLGKPLTEYIFVDNGDKAKVKQAEEDLRQTAVTQPAVLSVDTALCRMLAAYGVEPDMVMGHSLGEYGALVASGALPFADALKAVSARGSEMTKVSMDDNGTMAAVFGPVDQVADIIAQVDGYVVIANINSNGQAVIGGATQAVAQAVKAVQAAGFTARPLSVSHAFHTEIVAPASEPMTRYLDKLNLQSPRIPTISNVTGEFYPTGPEVKPLMLDLLGRQIASAVQFVKGAETLYNAGARVFVEVGPKRALHGFIEDLYGKDDEVLALSTNHPRLGDFASFNHALCGLYAAGLGTAQAAAKTETNTAQVESQPAAIAVSASEQAANGADQVSPPAGSTERLPDDKLVELGHLFADFLERGMQVYSGNASGAAEPARQLTTTCVTGAALGLPGTTKVFDDNNIARILAGEQFISAIPPELRQAMVDKHITRVVKDSNGNGSFETIDSTSDVIKLAARAGGFDLSEDFGYPQDRLAALDIVTRLAIAAGIDALRDAGIPLMLHYKTTTTGTKLPDRWMLPASLRDDTGVIFASAFPGYNAYANEMKGYYQDQARRKRLRELQEIRQSLTANPASSAAVTDLDQRIAALRTEIEKNGYVFDRRFLFRVLSMGHSQFAEYIGARGPNTQINGACSSTPQAIAIANDWIAAGRCRRVVVISADDITADDTLEWFAAGFLASGAAATDEKVEDAAIPFDRRRHGMVVGMGGASLVVESRASADERGLQPICDILNAVTANSAFHGTRLDVDHISGVMEQLVSQAEARWGISRKAIAPETVFVSHETYTPARGGSASAEVNALRQVFGDTADQIVIANTKGFTGHAMATGIEDVVAIKALETGIVPPVANHKEIDPDLGVLNLSRGGDYPVRYALRLGAGFGSQIAMSLIRWVPTADGRRRTTQELGFDYRIVDRARWHNWLRRVSGDELAELQVQRRTLRLADHGPAAQFANPSAMPLKSQPVQPSVEAAPVAASVPVTGSSPEPASVYHETPAAPLPAVDAVQARVLEIIGEKTGYPTDMLDMELDLEADLGIDTVKQAEMFAAIREEYGIPRDDNLQLRDFPTLKHTVQFVYDRRPDLKAAAPQVTAAVPSVTQSAPVSSAPAATDAVKEKVLAIIAEKTGYPPDMLDPELDLEADLGIDTVKQAEMFAAIREEYGIPRDDALQLRDFPTLAHTVQFVYDRRPDLQAAQTAAAPDTTSELRATAAQTSEAPPPAAMVGGGSNEVQQKVLAIIAEKTGYPPEMLDLDLDLEADLGIDTVKQAEMFAAIREEYDIARDDNLQLRDFPTLAHTIQFVFDKRPDLAVAAPATPANGTPAAVTSDAELSSASDDSVRDKVLAIIAEKTGYPPEMLDLDLDLEADLGIDTVKQAEMFAAIREEYDIARDDNLQLRDFPTLAHTIQFVYDRRPELQRETPADADPKEMAAPGTEGGPDAVQQKVLEIIAEKTGYPSEMLDLDLDLEADLGIDTVKQAEMFASIREAYDIPRDENLQLRDFPTLAHTIQFVYDKRPDLRAVPAAAGATAAAVQESHATGAGASEAVRRESQAAAGDMEAANKMPRRVPVAVLRPELGLCKATSVKLGADSRVLIMSDSGGVGKALVTRLKKRGVQPLVVDDVPTAEEMVERLTVWRKDGPIQGVYWLPALDSEGVVTDMQLSDWRSATHKRVKLLYTAMRALYEQVAGAGTFLVSATRLGGQHGYDAEGALNPIGGAVAGFTKTFKREKPETLAKVVDFGATRKTAALADLLIAETVSDPGVVEVGYKHERRWTIGLAEQPVSDSKTALELNKESVFVITGAAGSIVSAITSDLATASGGIFHLLDLTPQPDASDPDLQKFAEDKEGLKREIFQRLKDSGKKATPVIVEKELARLERLQAALNAIQAVEAAGGTVHYHCVNLLDGEAMKQVMQAIRKLSGRIDVLLHAGGLEISHLLPDKQPQEFDLVFDVKADGWFNLMSNLGDMPLGAAVVFSSIAGRFGNGGQTDYSAANDLLCKSVSGFKSARPATIGVAIDWTAWGGIGMAARGSIPTVMKAAGIDMLPPEAGIPVVRRELTLGVTSKEVVIAGNLGMMLHEFDEHGGLQIGDGSRLAAQPVANRIMTGHVCNMGLYSGLTVETTLDPEQQPFLHDHQIGGIPVLPGVMGLEAMVEAAMVLFPDLHVETVDDVAFMAPFKFYRNQPRTVTVQVIYSCEGDTVTADCILKGERMLHGKTEAEVTTHFKARVKLSPTPTASKKTKVPARGKSKAVVAADIYRLYFHGPAYQVLEDSWRSGKKIVGRFACNLPDNHVPASLESVNTPRLVELCFQTAGLLEMGEQARMGLPFGIETLSVLRQPTDREEALLAVVAPKAGNSFDAQVLDDKGNVFLTMKGYRTMELPSPIAAELLEPLKAISR